MDNFVGADDGGSSRRSMLEIARTLCVPHGPLPGLDRVLRRARNRPTLRMEYPDNR